MECLLMHRVTDQIRLFWSDMDYYYSGHESGFRDQLSDGLNPHPVFVYTDLKLCVTIVKKQHKFRSELYNVGESNPVFLYG